MTRSLQDPLLQVNGLAKHFDGLTALSSIHFNVYPQDVLGIVGPNGAGKSTLFHLITGYLSSSEGEILFQGQHIHNWRPERRVQAGIARTFQKTRLFHNLTVEHNVRLGTHLQQRGGLRRLLLGTPRREQQSLEAHIEHVLNITGFLQRRGELAGQLSFGFQRRLEVAVALGSRPKLLLLDEPFAGQSPQSVDQMGQLIKRLSGEGITIMLIEHRMESIVAYCNRLFVLRHGRLVIPKERTDAARV